MSHAPDPVLAALCERARERLAELAATPLQERGARIAELRALLAEIASRAADLDLRSPGFADEQAVLSDAVAALLAMDLDRGGPNVERYVARISEDLRRLASG